MVSKKLPEKALKKKQMPGKFCRQTFLQRVVKNGHDIKEQTHGVCRAKRGTHHVFGAAEGRTSFTYRVRF